MPSSGHLLSVQSVHGMSIFTRRRPQTYFRVFVIGALLLALWFKLPLLVDFERPSVKIDLKSTLEHVGSRDLPGANDTLVIMRTGSTELQDKLPIHLSTTLRRYPNYIIFSDYEEDFEGHHIFDALESVDPHMKETHPDFALWRRMKQYGRAALKSDELSGTSILVDQGTGKADNPGW